MTVVSSQKPSI